MNNVNDYGKTTYFPGGYPGGMPAGTQERTDGSAVTVFDGVSVPRTLYLEDFRKDAVYFGRSPQNDIVLTSPLVSAEHGRFIFRNGMWVIEDKAVYGGAKSTNGLIFNDASIIARIISDGDFIRIDDGVETVAQGVLFVFSSPNTENVWSSLPLAGKDEVTVGRDSACDITLSHVSVSNQHARIVREQDGFYIIDKGSTNGVIVNNKKLSGKVRLHEKDVIVITNSKLIFTSAAVFYCCYKSGISVDASDIVIKRGRGRKSFVTCDHVSLSVKPGELVAIIGGSGAGKSTVLNCMCGYLPPDNGHIYINGTDLYRNFDSLKKLVGYVPQSDIVYNDLTLHDMLLYTAKLRLPEDTSGQEIEDAITRAIDTVELSEKRDSLIRALSGGQRKRASIAVELLSDPNLLFLDEPASGLDPGTERNLMQSLRSMADNGKTVILVTHSTLQLQMCDRIVFMGKGGKLCFYGSYDEALDFFGVSDVVDIYNMITEGAPFWSEKYSRQRGAPAQIRETKAKSGTSAKNRVKQLKVLSARYMKLVTNDSQRLLLLLLQAPLLALLISIVADGEQFKQYEMTKSLLFALSCSAFWVGMLNAIQEICKERTIMKREYMTGLSLSSYVCSKMAVLGVLCLIQSVCIVTVFSLRVGLPRNGVMFPPYLELLITAFLTAVASTAMGLFVSCLFSNADRAMTVAPLLLMPQILFSGLIFKLSGVTETVSWLAVCRWSMEGFGTTADLNKLELRLQQEEEMLAEVLEHDFEKFYDFSAGHLLRSWLILAVFAAVCLILARLVLGKVGKERA